VTGSSHSGAGHVAFGQYDGLCPRDNGISGLNHTSHAAAVYASWPSLPQAHATLASRRLATPYLGWTSTSRSRQPPGAPLPTLVWGFVCQGVCRDWLATSGEVREVDLARADQAGAARPGRCGSKVCAIGERCHPQGRSAAEQLALASLTTIADRATADRLRSGLWVGCRHRFEQLPIGSEGSSPAAAEQ